MSQLQLPTSVTAADSEWDAPLVELDDLQLGAVVGGLGPVGGWGPAELSAGPVGGW